MTGGERMKGRAVIVAAIVFMVAVFLGQTSELLKNIGVIGEKPATPTVGVSP